MCARRFLIAVFILTLLVVAGAFAIFQFGQKVLIESATPKGEFRAPPPRSGPDYAQLTSWIAHPDIEEGDPSYWGPAGSPPPTLQPRAAATFFIHPTTYLQRDRWNAPLSGSTDADMRAALFVQSQASAFNQVSEIWAPRYRQAAYGAFLLDSRSARQALDLAYSDVKAAFEEFLEKVPPGEPIILAGHSQGALHLSRLLAEFGIPLRDRLVAAYVIGWPLSVTADLPAMGLPPCTAADQNACILSWQSFGEPANPSLVLEAWEGTTGPTGAKHQREDMLCVNPITGTRGGEAPPAANPGTLIPNGSLTDATVEPGLVGARCEEGILILTGDVPNLGPFVLPGNNYHVYDYALFWGAIRQDAQRRMQARAQ